LSGIRSTFDIATGLARAQHGRVACRQLLAAGVDRARIRRWLADGRLHRVHDGVYAVGHDAPRLARGTPPPPEVTVPTTAGRRRPGIIVHRVKALHHRDTSSIDGIPVTTVPRTLLDLALREPPPQLTRMCHEAWIHHRTTPAHIAAAIARNPHKPGAAKLRRAQGADVLLSELEHGFKALLRRSRLPLPRTNIDVKGDKVDCYWPGLDLTVELHSWRYHGTRQAFEQDLARRRRSNHLAFGYGDVFERPQPTVAELEPLLKPASAPPRASSARRPGRRGRGRAP
jgi:hypothetical protein